MRLNQFATVRESDAHRGREMMSPTNTRVFGIEKYGETLVVTPLGDAIEFRYTEIHQDTNAICDLIGREKIANLVIELGDATILGSVMISSIIKMARKISEKQGQACFCQAGDSMREVIHSMSLTKLWPYFDSLDEAIGSFDEG